MKKFLILLCVLPFLFYSCDESEGCDETVISPVTVIIRARVSAIDSNGDDVENQSVGAEFTKYWCDGDKAPTIVYIGTTDISGVYTILGPDYTFNNELDYVLVNLFTSTGLDWSKKIYPKDITLNTEVTHTFVVN